VPRSRALPKKGPYELRTKCGFTFGKALVQILVKSLTKAIIGCKALCSKKCKISPKNWKKLPKNKKKPYKKLEGANID
jgi:hypothetical protein